MKRLSSFFGFMFGLLFLVVVVLSFAQALGTQTLPQSTGEVARQGVTATPPLEPSPTTVPGAILPPALPPPLTPLPATATPRYTAVPWEVAYPAPPRPTGSPPAPTPWSSPTSLPIVLPGTRTGFWSENLVWGPLTPLGANLKDYFSTARWSPDGTKLAFSLNTGQRLRDAQGNSVWAITTIALVDEIGQTIPALAEGFDPLWSPDGSHIAYLVYPDWENGLRLRVINVQTRVIIEAAVFTSRDLFPKTAWISANELVFFKKEPVVFDITSGQTRPFLNAEILAQAQGPQPLEVFTALPAKGLVGVGSGSELLLLAWSNGVARFIRRVPDGLNYIWWSFSPDGELLAYNTGAQIKIVGVVDPTILVELPVYGRSPKQLSWSPDSASLVFVGPDVGGQIVNRDGSNLRPLPGVPTEMRHIFWSPNGTQVLVGSLEGELYVLPVIAP